MKKVWGMEGGGNNIQIVNNFVSGHVWIWVSLTYLANDWVKGTIWLNDINGDLVKPIYSYLLFWISISHFSKLNHPFDRKIFFPMNCLLRGNFSSSVDYISRGTWTIRLKFSYPLAPEIFPIWYSKPRGSLCVRKTFNYLWHSILAQLVKIFSFVRQNFQYEKQAFSIRKLCSKTWNAWRIFWEDYTKWQLT